jgi:hypothetical protein
MRGKEGRELYFGVPVRRLIGVKVLFYSALCIMACVALE